MPEEQTLQSPVSSSSSWKILAALLVVIVVILGVVIFFLVQSNTGTSDSERAQNVVSSSQITDPLVLTKQYVQEWHTTVKTLDDHVALMKKYGSQKFQQYGSNNLTSEQKNKLIQLMKQTYPSYDQLDFVHAVVEESTPNNYYGKGVTRVEIPFLKNSPAPRDGPSLKFYLVKENGFWKLDSEGSI
jgi:hypothetical protein